MLHQILVYSVLKINYIKSHVSLLNSSLYHMYDPSQYEKMIIINHHGKLNFLCLNDLLKLSLLNHEVDMIHLNLVVQDQIFEVDLLVLITSLLFLR